MATWHKVTVDVLSAGVDVKEASALAEDTAWDMAIHAAEHEGVDIGSDRFVKSYNQLRSKFDECSESYAHLHHVSARAVKALMAHNLAVMVDGMSETTVQDIVHELVSTVFSIMTVVYATGPHGWLRDSEWRQLPDADQTTSIVFHAIDLNEQETE